MKAHYQDDLRIAERAAEWFFTLRDAGPQQQAAFGAWLRESPRHAEEFLLVTAAYRELDAMDHDRPIDIEALRQAAASSLVALPARYQSPPARSRPRTMAATTATAIVVLGWVVWALSPDRHSYSTAVGEIRSFELKDGSVIHLNTDSRVKVRFSAAAREIELGAGEATFKVARDPARPFRVHAGQAVIQAVGTQFNVYRRTRGTTVAVLEGLVRVSMEGDPRHLPADNDRDPKKPRAASSTEKLAAGEGVDIAPDGHITRLAQVDAAKMTAWRQRRLFFKEDTLTEVAEQFNRYNRSPQIQVQDAAVGDKHLSGVFDADDPESLLSFIGDLDDVVIERTAQKVIIRSR